MRKIEKEMVRAVALNKSWQSGNTEVAGGVRVASVYLHGHKIAHVIDRMIVVPNLKVIRQWPTVTTKSRLRALGVNIYTKKGITYVDNEAVSVLIQSNIDFEAQLLEQMGL
jgi:hypothetical protein